MSKLACVLTRTNHKFSLLILVALAAAGFMAISLNVQAQSGAGSIQGTVSDSTGAVIPDATIHVVNAGTNVATDTKSNNVGFYQVPALFTGTYTITVTAPGMATYKANVELQVAQNAVINAKLSAGAVTTQIEVSSDIAQLTTTDNGTITSTL